MNGDLSKLSRYVYTDYSIGTVIGKQQQQGHRMHGITYDIFCQWFPKFQERLASYAPFVDVQLPIQGLTGGIPKFHMAAHRDECYIRYSLNNTHGFGRMDGEALERTWAFLNDISGSASGKGPGARIDQLNQLQDHWNWQKLTTLGQLASNDLKHLPNVDLSNTAPHLTSKYWQAKKMYLMVKTSWDQFNAGLPEAVIRQWETLSVDPTRVNGTWTSVFVTQEEPSGEPFITLNLHRCRQLILVLISGTAEHSASSAISSSTEPEQELEAKSVLSGIIKVEALQ